MTKLPVNQRTRIRILQLAALLMVVPFLTIHPAFDGDGSDLVEKIGVGLVLFCVAGRMWSVLYIGSRKNRELVTAGPYSVMRNPLYFFSMIGAAGIGLFIGSLVMAFFLGFATWLALTLTAEREAHYLETLFGDSYREYAARTPMFWPNPLLYREADEVAFSPAALRRTFLDGLIFIAVLPAIEVTEFLRHAGYFPVLLNLP